MSEVVAVVGSRSYSDLDQVVEFLRALWKKYPETTIISGGARGVDQTAEKTWLRLGGKLVSLRPRKKDEQSYVIDRWELGGDGAGVSTPDYYLEWANFASAALFRDMLFAEEAHRCVAFWNGMSRGTAFTLECFDVSEKPSHARLSNGWWR